MRKKYAVIIISYLTAVMLVLTGMLIVKNCEAKYYKNEICLSLERSTGEFFDAMNEIDSQLEKYLYLSSPKQMSVVSALLLKNCETAKSALSHIPDNMQKPETLNKFITQAGNFACYITEKAITLEELKEEDTENLNKLNRNSKIIIEAMNEINSEFNNTEYWLKTVDDRISGQLEETDIGNAFLAADQNITDYPKLIYDGPFSEKINENESKMLKNMSDVTVNTAIENAAVMLNVAKGYLSGEESDSKSGSYYNVSGENVFAKVTKKGGIVSMFRKYKDVGENNIQNSEAVSIAKKYLNEKGYTDMKETYYYEDEGVCLINFAFLDNNRICYPDLIKVGVALDNGEILIFDASSYIQNHTEREYSRDVKTLEDATAKISPKLNIERANLAVIPTESGEEKYCYEFVGKGVADTEIIIFLNAVTLEEEDIFIKIDTLGGTLVK